jgi:hypothetical protein
MLKTKTMLEDTPKTIRVSFKTYRELVQLGIFGDSFDSIITNLLLNQEKHTVQKGNAKPSNPLENPDQIHIPLSRSSNEHSINLSKEDQFRAKM